MQAKPSRCQKILLLVKDLETFPSTASIRARKMLEKNVLPDLTLVKIPFLQKKKPEKLILLKKLWDPAILNEEHFLNEEYNNLKTTILAPAFQFAINSSRFEMVHWCTQIRKFAGFIMIISFFFVLNQ